jgi:hypothetical protein
MGMISTGRTLDQTAEVRAELVIKLTGAGLMNTRACLIIPARRSIYHRASHLIKSVSV